MQYNSNDKEDFPLAELGGLAGDEPEPLIAHSALREILRALGTAPTIEDGLREAALTLHQWTSADAAAIYSLRPGHPSLRQIHSVGFSRGLVQMCGQLSLEDNLTGLAVQQQRLLFSMQLDQDERIPAHFSRQYGLDGIQTLVSLPLMRYGVAVGAVCLGWTRKLHMTDSDRDLLMSLGFGIAIVVNDTLLEQPDSGIAQR